MIAKIVTAAGQEIRGPYNTDRVPSVGELYQTSDAEYTVKSIATQHPEKDGVREIVVVTVAPSESPMGTKQAHGRKQLNG